MTNEVRVIDGQEMMYDEIFGWKPLSWFEWSFREPEEIPKDEWDRMCGKPEWNEDDEPICF